MHTECSPDVAHCEAATCLRPGRVVDNWFARPTNMQTENTKTRQALDKDFCSISYQTDDPLLGHSPDVKHLAAFGRLNPGTLMGNQFVMVSVKHAAHCPGEPHRFAGKRRLVPTLLQETTYQFQATAATRSPTDSISMESRCTK